MASSSSQASLAQAEATVQRLESEYVRGGGENQRNDLLVALRDVQLIRLSAANKKLLYQSQRVFEQGERSGLMLAWLSLGSLQIPHTLLTLRMGRGGCYQTWET